MVDAMKKCSETLKGSGKEESTTDRPSHSRYSLPSTCLIYFACKSFPNCYRVTGQAFEKTNPEAARGLIPFRVRDPARNRRLPRTDPLTDNCLLHLETT